MDKNQLEDAIKNLEVRVEYLENFLDKFHTKEREIRTPNELFQQAKQIVRTMNTATSSLLQRKLHIGYARAARLLDQLEDDGIIGPGIGARPRKVFLIPKAKPLEK